MKSTGILIGAIIVLSVFSIMLVTAQSGGAFPGLIEVLEEIRDAIANQSPAECEFEEYNFEESLGLSASQGVVGSGAILERYYDFESADEVIDGTLHCNIKGSFLG